MGRERSINPRRTADIHRSAGSGHRRPNRLSSGSSMSGPERPCSIGRQQRPSPTVLRQSVEATVHGGPSKVKIRSVALLRQGRKILTYQDAIRPMESCDSTPCLTLLRQAALAKGCRDRERRSLNFE